MDDNRKALVPHLAEMLRRKGIAEVSSKEERTRFWQRAKTSEQEQQLWVEAMTGQGLTPETMTPEQATQIGLGIAQQVYPDRFDMMTGEGRTTQSQWDAWAMKHARQGPPPEEGMTNGQRTEAGGDNPPEQAQRPRPEDPANAVRPPDQGPYPEGA